MNRITVLGSGAAPGVPAVARGWGDCNPNNPKNRRRRTTIYLQLGTTKLLIDTSPDLREQLLDARIQNIDAVLYTHAHADHLHGIDDLREINRFSGHSLDIYADEVTAGIIKTRFSYLLAQKDKPNNPIYQASLLLNKIKHGQSFDVNGTKITPIDLEGHSIASVGYIFNDGEIVYIADCMEIPSRSLDLIRKQPKLLVMPLTSIISQSFHLGLEKLLEYVRLIQPEKTIINHMAAECDYDHVNALTPDNVFPAFDGMTLDL
jgi:phosphoribosyl 1,2-cyclic phosphate phosphodiesterase